MFASFLSLSLLQYCIDAVRRAINRELNTHRINNPLHGVIR
nr:MAG TPA: DNA-binding protein [Caudoviricetes sp.]